MPFKVPEYKRLTIRTKPPDYYVPPMKEDIETLAKKVDLTEISHDLAADIANIDAGGSFENADVLLQHCKKKLAEEGASIINPDAANRFNYHSSVQDFLRTLNLKDIPGNSPMERAVGTLKILSMVDPGFGIPNKFSMIPSLNHYGQVTAKKVNALTTKLKTLTQEEIELLTGKKDGSDKTSEQDGFFQKLDLAEKIVKFSNTMFDMSRKIDMITDLSTYKIDKEVEDPEGDNSTITSIKDLDDFDKIVPEDLAIYMTAPGVFWKNLTDDQINVRKITTYKLKKQAIYIVCDCSGSMEGEKHQKANGIVFNRLKAVLRNEAELWLSSFDTDFYFLGKATNKEEAAVLMHTFEEKNFTGGGTNTANAIQKAHASITEALTAPGGEHLVKPEIWVITDDDVTVSKITKNEIPGVIIHGFAVSDTNYGLKKLVKSTGGVYKKI